MYLENGKMYPETDDERWALEVLEADKNGGYDRFALAALYDAVAHNRIFFSSRTHASQESITPTLPDTATENLRRYRILREAALVHRAYEEVYS